MRCQDRDADLLLYGLGELPLWQRLRLGWHLRSCARCRERQAELASASRQIAAALGPEGGGGPGPGLPARPAWLGLAALVLILVLSVLTVTLVARWYRWSHAVPAAAVRDQGCRPDLPSDQCR